MRTVKITYVPLLIVIAILIVIIFVFVDASNSVSENVLKIYFELGISTIAAGIFYLFQVYLPQQRKKGLIKNSFLHNYKNFKEECIGIIIDTIEGSTDYTLAKNLMNLSNFKQYADTEISGISKWDTFRNNLNDRTYRQILMQFETIQSEIDFLIYSVDIGDKDLLDLLKRFKKITILLKDLDFEYEDDKRLLLFFYELFGGWTMGTGSQTEDIIEQNVLKI